METASLSKSDAKDQLNKIIGHLMLVANSPRLENKEGVELTEYLERAVEFRRLGAEVWESRLSKESIENAEGWWGDRIEKLRNALESVGILVNKKEKDDILNTVAESVADAKSISRSIDAFMNYRAAFVEKVINEGEKPGCKELMIAGYNALLEGGNRHLEFLWNRFAFCEKYGLVTDNIIIDINSERKLNNLRNKQIERLREATSTKEALKIAILGFKETERKTALSSYEALYGNRRE
jgi:hypothetical protein